MFGGFVGFFVLFYFGWFFFFPLCFCVCACVFFSFFCSYFVAVTVAVADFILHPFGKEFPVCVWIPRTAGEMFTLSFTRCLFPSQLPSL